MVDVTDEVIEAVRDLLLFKSDNLNLTSIFWKGAELKLVLTAEEDMKQKTANICFPFEDI